MKLLTALLLASLSLYAGIFTSQVEAKKVLKTNKQIHASFRQNVSDANAIIKRGEYTKFATYKAENSSIIERIEKLDIDTDNKKQLKNDILTYSALIKTLGTKLQTKAPELNHHYKYTIHNLKTFNQNLASIGYRPLLYDFRELSTIKNKFVKKPSKSLERKFNEKWSAVMVTLTELYLDDDMEEPLVKYLQSYKSYFVELSSAYNSLNYFNINKLKPLSYKIKAQLELYIPYKSGV